MPFWKAMSNITAAGGQLWNEGYFTNVVRKGICGAKDENGRVTGYWITKKEYKNEYEKERVATNWLPEPERTKENEKLNNELTVDHFTPARRTALACFGAVCGPPVVLGHFVRALVLNSGTKEFLKDATDDDVELFCHSPSAMAVTSIVIRKNVLVTGRAMSAIGMCFWLRKVDMDGCKEMTGGWGGGFMVCMFVCLEA